LVAGGTLFPYRPKPAVVAPGLYRATAKASTKLWTGGARVGHPAPDRRPVEQRDGNDGEGPGHQGDTGGAEVTNRHRASRLGDSIDRPLRRADNQKRRDGWTALEGSGTMETTLTIDDDLLTVARQLAAARSSSVDAVISELIRRGLQSAGVPRQTMPLPVFEAPPGAKPITLEDVRRADDEP